ncbi:unnamed protein product [Microthlaspi erraticum]|uniref:Uncharacterized protein n=1 Tax=Microthlaspi erraticum TaxID=1685480 RepID=A0A6D2L4C8_9BRAS|nr:unnamed protein product [Microthlaspi erraticum]CAA7046654.1 unnamed protein product [Microthlaspi erraticum]CAA7049480.1 unnamed protein product [Microthlaspi erraticum]CAA7059315.1 unnamed protein product [Microthlaspi erraticum]
MSLRIFSLEEDFFELRGLSLEEDFLERRGADGGGLSSFLGGGDRCGEVDLRGETDLCGEKDGFLVGTGLSLPSAGSDLSIVLVDCRLSFLLRETGSRWECSLSSSPSLLVRENLDIFEMNSEKRFQPHGGRQLLNPR